MSTRTVAGLIGLGLAVCASIALRPTAATVNDAAPSRIEHGPVTSIQPRATWVPLAGEVMVNIYELPEAARTVEPWRLRYYCPADFNKDNHLDAMDATLFLAVYTVRDGPMVPWLDINQDGTVDDADLAAFFQALQDGACDPLHQAEIRGIIC